MQIMDTGLAIIMYIGFLIVSPWFLKLGLIAIKSPQRSIGRTILTAIFNWLVIVIPIAGLIIQWFIIKARHKISLGKSVLAWLIGVVVPIIIVVPTSIILWWILPT